jgi:predicted nucleic acid-binding protein
MIVVDASVAVKWYLQEQGSEQAAAVLTGLARPIGPERLRVEVISALCNQSRLDNPNPEHIRVLCARWMADLGRELMSESPSSLPTILPPAGALLPARQALASTVLP